MGHALNTPLLAEGYARIGRIAEGLALLDDGLKLVQEAGFQMIESDLYRSQGDLLLESGRAEAAETCYGKAIESARRIEAKSWELRATLRLSHLWHRQGKADSAHELLSSIYDWFTEGFDTPDLHEARLLLKELGND